MEADLYQLFRVAPEAPFSVIKRAYYARAKECHPDRFGNSPVKTAEFQELAAAFNILSDPLLRRRYDRERLGAAGIDWESPEGPVLDTEADDILEELIQKHQPKSSVPQKPRCVFPLFRYLLRYLSLKNLLKDPKKKKSYQCKIRMSLPMVFQSSFYLTR